MTWFILNYYYWLLSARFFEFTVLVLKEVLCIFQGHSSILYHIQVIMLPSVVMKKLLLLKTNLNLHLNTLKTGLSLFTTAARLHTNAFAKQKLFFFACQKSQTFG